MADVTYTPKFKHTDWIDGQSIVQAGGADGFNDRFHGIEGDFNQVTTVVGQVNAAIKNVQQLKFVKTQSQITVNPNSMSSEFDVDSYDKASLADPAVDRVYHCIISPSPPTAAFAVVQTFIYHPVAATNGVRVTIVFFNPTPAAVQFSYRILALGGAI